MNKMKERYLNYLATKINANGGSNVKCEETIDSIIENLVYLAERMSTEEKKLYIPLQFKRILLWLLTDGNYSLDVSVKEYKPTEYVIVTAIITVNGNKTSVDYMSIPDAVAAFGISDADRNKQMVNSAMVSAVTRAVTQCGIGLDIIGDIEDDIQTPSGENQTMEATDETVKLDAESEKIKEILSDSTETKSDSYDSDAYKTIVVPYGSYKDKLLGDCPPKIVGYIKALVDTNQFTVPNEQYESLVDFVASNEPAKKQYDACMATKRNG